MSWISCWSSFYIFLIFKFSQNGKCVVCPVTLRRKEIQEWEQEYWWVSRSLMTARKISFMLWVRTWKKTVAHDRIKHLTVKLRGPVGLGGMNKWWKNELLREHWPKSWMCSSHVVMVCYCSWNRQEESVKKWGQKNVTPPFILPGEVLRAEWHESISLDEIYKFKTPMAKTISALNNNLKFFLLQSHAKSTNSL